MPVMPMMLRFFSQASSRSAAPVIGRIGDIGFEHHAADAGQRRHVDGLDVLVIGADIADMREGEGDDLPGIGRIGQDLLVAGHGGVEADLARGMADGADAAALEAGWSWRC